MRFITLLIAALLLAGSSFAQNGKIAGKISDKTYGEAVIGATVTVQGTTSGAVTDVDGNFIIAMPAGEYTVEVKYIGYQQKNIEGVVVKPGQSTNVNVILEESTSTQMSEVVVTARMERETVNALYIQQRNSVSLSSGISADIIQRSPDKNTGEVLKRVSGASIQDGKYVVIRGLNDRYNMAMLNNALMPSTETDRKAFSFDIVPSNVIDNIIINKTATPDMPGDFAGGVVKVLTKDVPEKNFINIGIGAGYNSQTTFKDFTKTPTSGAPYVAFPSQNHALSSSWGETFSDYNSKMDINAKTKAVKELPENSYTTNTKSALPNTSLQLSAGKGFDLKKGGKIGVVAAASTSNSMTTITDLKRGKYYADGGIHTRSTETQHRQVANSAALLNIAYTKGKSRISLKNLYNKLYDEAYIDRLGYSTGSDQQNPFYITVPQERAVLNNQLEGSHAIGSRNIKAEWNLNYSNMRASQNDFRTMQYSRSITGGFYEDPQISSDPLKLIDRESRRFFSTQRDDNYGANASVSYPFEIKGNKQNLKVGYMGQMKNREFSARMFQHRLADVTQDQLLLQPRETIFNHSNFGPQGFELREMTNHTDRYTASASLHAGYVMLDNILAEKWRLIWGVRYESYTQTLESKTMSGTPIEVSTPFNDILPSLNLTYDLNEKQKIRFAASRTVNRPEFREIAPFAFTDFENIWAVKGNTALVRSNITNLDLRYEIYSKPGEVVSVGAFYKHFENPIEMKMDDQSTLDFLMFTYANAKSAYAAGLEFEARKSLSFVGSAPWLENLVAGTNLTYIYSRVDASGIIGKSNVVGTKAERPLQGQSPYIVNVSLMYNAPKSGWALSALYNRVGERIKVVGNASIPATWENGRNIVDLQVSKKVLKNKGELKLTVSDLLNSPTVLYWNTDKKDSYKKGDSINGRGNDLIFQQYRTGVGVSLGFRYTIGE